MCFPVISSGGGGALAGHGPGSFLDQSPHTSGPPRCGRKRPIGSAEETAKPRPSPAATTMVDRAHTSKLSIVDMLPALDCCMLDVGMVCKVLTGS